MTALLDMARKRRVLLLMVISLQKNGALISTMEPALEHLLSMIFTTLAMETQQFRQRKVKIQKPACILNGPHLKVTS
jgi:hypothetical protein